MENCSGYPRCLICRRVALKNTSINLAKPVSNVAILQDFFYCFRINVLDSEVHDLSTSCHFCPSCEQFITEWSRIKNQMTQLTRRAAQLKATISALFLSTYELLEQNHNEDVTENINNIIQNSQEIELPRLLQQTVDCIRDELQKKYSVRVMLDKIQLPFKQNLDALPVSYNGVDEASDQFVVANDSDVEYLPSDRVSADEITPGHLLKTEEEGNSDYSSSQDCVDSREMSIKARNTRKRKRKASKAITVRVGPNRFKYREMSFQRNEEDQTYTCDACGFKSRPSMKSIRDHLYRHLRKKVKELRETSERQPVTIPNGSNRFKYNGYDVWFNGQHQQYYCGVCNFKCRTSVINIQNHIRLYHYTAEDKIKFTAVKLSDTKWQYGRKYKIIKTKENKFKCVSCGSMTTRLDKVVEHIRSQHVELEGPEKVIHLPEKETPSLNVASVDTPVIKVEPMLTDNGTVDELRDHSEFGAGASHEEYLPREDPFIDAVTPGQFLEIRIKTEDEADPDCSYHVMSDNSQLPPVLHLEPVPTDNATAAETWDQLEFHADIQIPFVPKLEPLPVGENNVDEPSNDSQFGADDFVEENLSKEDELDDEESSNQILGLRSEADDEANCDDSNSQDSVDSKEMNLKAGTRKTNWCKNKLLRKHQTVVVPDGPNKFKYNGHDLRLNDEDQCYYCGACDFKGKTSIHSVLNHIRQVHYTKEDKQKWMAVQTSETEWVYGDYKIVRVGENFQCVSCGYTASELHSVNNHIRTTHTDVEGAHKVAPLQVTGKPSAKGLTPIEGKYNSVPYTFNPAENTYTCGICQTKVPNFRSNLGRHIMKYHTEAARSVTCEICGKELSNQAGYKRHMESHQAVLKNCPTCNKKFYCQKNFNRHVKIHLLGEAAKKYQCEHCGDKFYLRHQYRQHVRKHTGELPYECVDCGKKYRINTSLTSHRKRFHGVKKGPTRNVIRINE